MDCVKLVRAVVMMLLLVGDVIALLTVNELMLW